MEPRAGSVFSARLVKVRSERAWSLAIDAFFVLLCGPNGEEGTDPRYRILVKRGDADGEVGVAVARTRRKASRLLVEVQRDLVGLSLPEFIDRYGLGTDPGEWSGR